ncbi:MAG: hypothetical protein Kow00120_08140 [Anaerolineae bacterium]
MSGPLRALILEDRPDDAELIVYELQRAGFDLEWQVVDNEADYLAHLDAKLDVIVADYALPQFDGVSALKLLQERGLDIPYILVSGTIGEELAVECIKIGATDYVLKDRLNRLPPAVSRALAEKRLRAENRKAEEALRASEARYRALFDNANDAIYVLDMDGRILDANRIACERLGYSRDALLQMRITQLNTPEFAASFPARMDTLRAQGYLLFETLHIRQDGSMFPIEANVRLIDYGGRPAALSIARDISERKEAEAKLRESEARYRELINNMSGGVAVYEASDGGADFIIRDMNRAGRRITETQKEAVIGKSVKQVFPQVAAFGLFKVLQEVWRTGRPQRHPVAFYEDERLALWADNYVYKLPSGEVVAIFNDVTERKWAEDALRESEERHRLLFDNAGLGIGYYTPQGRVIAFNKVAAAYMRGEPEDFAGKSLADLYGEETAAVYVGRIEAAVGSEASQVYEDLVPLPSGDKWFRSTYSRITDASGSVVGVQIISDDITARRQAEEALRASEHRYQVISELISDYAFSYRVAPDGTRTLDWSTADAFTRVTGFTVEEVQARGKLALFHPDDTPAVSRDLERVRAGEAVTGEYRIITKSGETRWLRIYRRPVWDVQENRVVAYYGVAQDITERNQAEEALRASERFARSTLDGLSAHIAIVDETGAILAVNKAWRDFADANSPVAMNVCEGADYLQVCDGARGPSSEGAAEFAEGMRAVLAGEVELFEMEYPCHAPDKERWFVGRVTPFPGDGPRRAVVAHENVTQRKRAEARTLHLNAVLRVIRNVNQLIVREQNRDRLLVDACKTLVGTRSYRNAWIALLDEAGKPVQVAQAGLEGPVSDLSDLIEGGGQLPACVQRALAQPGVVVAAEPEWMCADCPVRGKDVAGGGMSVRMEHAGRVYGVLTAYIGADLATVDVEEEASLFAEVAADIAFALHDIELDEERHRALDALAEERNLLRTLIDNLPDIVYTKDTEGRFILTNRAHLSLLGASKFSDVIGRTDHDFYPHALVERYRADEQSIIQSGQALMNHEEPVLDHRTGEQRWLRTSKVPLLDPHGEVVGLVGIGHDITEQRTMQDVLLETNQMLQALVAGSPLAITVPDLEGRVRLWNPAAEGIFGCREEDVRGGPLPFVPEDLADDFADLLDIARQGTALSGLEMRLRTKAGALVDCSFAVAALYDAQGHIDGLLSLFENITEQKHAEEALREREILRVELDKQRELNQLKTRFISMVSHEYRNPLATILVTSNALRDYMEKMSKEQVTERLDRIKAQVEHMTALIEEALEIGKLEAGAVQFAPTPIDLDRLCRDIVDEFRGAGPAGQRLTYTSEGAFDGANVDASLMRQIVTNLLSNALKYTPAGNPVQVHLQRDGHAAILRVADQGIGIPEADQKRLFTPFHRAENVGNVGGTGLGLAIVKRAVDLHGGAITCTSAVGVGTTFTVVLPFVLKE